MVSRRGTLLRFVTIGLVLTLGLTLWLSCLVGFGTGVSANSRGNVSAHDEQGADCCIQTVSPLTIDKLNAPTFKSAASQPLLEQSPAGYAFAWLTSARFETSSWRWPINRIYLQTPVLRI